MMDIARLTAEDWRTIALHGATAIAALSVLVERIIERLRRRSRDEKWREQYREEIKRAIADAWVPRVYVDRNAGRAETKPLVFDSDAVRKVVSEEVRAILAFNNTRRIELENALCNKSEEVKRLEAKLRKIADGIAGFTFYAPEHQLKDFDQAEFEKKERERMLSASEADLKEAWTAKKDRRQRETIGLGESGSSDLGTSATGSPLDEDEDWQESGSW